MREASAEVEKAQLQTSMCAASLDASCLLILSLLSLDVIVRVGSATQVEADKDEAATDQETTQQDVDQGGGPEGKQVESLVTIGTQICGVLVVVWLVDRVDPHITSYKPAEEKEGGQRVPDGADATERTWRPLFWLPSTRQAGQQCQHQAKDPHHNQIDGDIVLPRTVIQVYRTDCNLSGGHDTKKQL